jgi:hypothetical protein
MHAGQSNQPKIHRVNPTPFNKYQKKVFSSEQPSQLGLHLSWACLVYKGWSSIFHSYFLLLDLRFLCFVLPKTRPSLNQPLRQGLLEGCFTTEGLGRILSKVWIFPVGSKTRLKAARGGSGLIFSGLGRAQVEGFGLGLFWAFKIQNRAWSF